MPTRGLLGGAFALAIVVAAIASTAQPGRADDEADSLARVRTLAARASERLKAGDAREAVTLLAEAADLAERSLGGEHLELGVVLANLGVARLETGDARAARSALTRALAIHEGKLGEDDPRLASILTSLSAVTRRTGDLDGARRLAERALSLRERGLGRDDPALVPLLVNLSMILLDLDRREEAAEAGERARAILGPTPEDQLALSRVLDIIARARGRGTVEERAESRRLLARVVEIREASLGPDHPSLATALHNLGVFILEGGEPDRARPILERAVAIAERSLGVDHSRTVDLRMGLGYVLERCGDVPAARATFERVLAAQERTLAPTDIRLAVILHHLGRTLHLLGAHDRARPVLERALAVARAGLGEDHPHVARIADGLITVRRLAGELDGALQLAQRSVAILEARFDAEHIELAPALDDLAMVHLARGDTDAARRTQERALAIREKVLGAESAAAAESLELLGAVALEAGDAGVARPLYERALAIGERVYGPSHPRLRSRLAGLARCWSEADEPERAGPLIGRALEIHGATIRRRLAGATPTERLALVASTPTLLDDWLVATAAAGRSGYEPVLATRGLAFRVAVAERVIGREVDEETRAVVVDLREAERRLAGLAQASGAAGYELREAWARQAQRRDELALELARRSPALRAAVASLDVDLRSVQRALEPGAVLLDTVRVGRGDASGGRGARYVAWIVVRVGPPRRVELGPAAPIEAAIERFRAALLAAEAADDPGFLAAGAALHERLWKPIADALPDASTVYLVPSGALATVPFAAIPSGDGRSLVDDRTIVHLVTPAELLDARRGRRGSGAALVGAIDYGAAGGRFAELPATAAELDAVRERFLARHEGEPVTELRGRSATEAAFREAVVGKRLVHVATHGFVRHDRPSALEARGAATPLSRPSLERHLTGVDPMLLAGLALSGAGRELGPLAAAPADGDDGILTALEASALDLSAADLVVLSACDTAGGAVRAGEGVVGLARGFRVAGARAVVASLWPVDDEATRRLMGAFHERALGDSGDRPGRALGDAARWLQRQRVSVIDREASLREGRDVMRERSFGSPRDWAGFVVYGRGRAR